MLNLQKNKKGVDMSMFQKAEKKQVKLKIALTAPSGGGKTFSALLLARGLVGKNGKIAVVDTEKKSASLYADRFEFDVLDLSPPYTTEKYIDAIKEAQKQKYDIVILDSISHAWAGEGGLLDQKEQIDSRGKGSSYTNWAQITKKHEKFISNLLHSDIHLIATMRSKQDYILVDRNGKQVPTKVGLAPVQRDGMEYEFTCVLDIAMNHEAQSSKDRTGLFPSDRIFKIAEETGQELCAWMLDGKPLPQASDIANEITEMLDVIWNDDLKSQVLKSFNAAGENVSELMRIRDKLYSLPEVKTYLKTSNETKKGE